MERYESYKDSGIEWIGKIPSHWKIYRFKDFLTLQNVVSSNENKIGLENIEGGTGRFIETNTDFDGNGIEFDVGDIVYGKLRPYLQKVWVATFNGNAVGDFFVFRTKPICDRQYVFYVMLSEGFTAICNGATFGTKMPRVSSDFIRCLHFYLPPFVEQQAIAAYLDKRCSEIDKAIATQQKRIALLQELKQSIITHAVTRGIHPDVPLKESGVEWIGKVPKHWEVRRMKFLTREYKAGPFGSALITSKLSDNGSVLVYTPEHSANQSTQLVNNLYLPETRVKEMSQFFVKVNDVIFSIVGTLGRAMLITEDMPKGIINQRLAKFSVNEKDILIEYLLWLFAHSIFYEHYMQLYQRGSVIVNLTKEIIGNMPVPLPPINEQYQIVAYLKECTIKLDTYIAHAEQRIALLQELKQSIITEAITGKIKVC